MMVERVSSVGGSPCPPPPLTDRITWPGRHKPRLHGIGVAEAEHANGDGHRSGQLHLNQECTVVRSGKLDPAEVNRTDPFDKHVINPQDPRR